MYTSISPIRSHESTRKILPLLLTSVPIFTTVTYATIFTSDINYLFVVDTRICYKCIRVNMSYLVRMILRLRTVDRELFAGA